MTIIDQGKDRISEQLDKDKNKLIRRYKWDLKDIQGKIKRPNVIIVAIEER